MLGVGIAASRVSGGFSPTKLFTGGVVGAWYDPTDIGTLFKDVAGTDPVTADGDAVALMLDKSGNGKHMLQATSGSRPLYKIDLNGKPYLYANDPDSWMSCANFDLTTINSLSIFAGIQRDSIAAFSVLCELSTAVGSNNGSFYITAPNSVGNNVGFATKGGAIVNVSKTTTDNPLKTTVVCLSDISTPHAEIRVGQLPPVTSSDTQGVGTYPTYGNHTLYLFRRAGTSFQFSGRLYNMIIRGASSTEAEIAATYNFVNSKVIL